MEEETILEDPDVVLKVGNEEFQCRRNVLAKNSVYFQAMFSNNFAEYCQKVIEIQGVKGTTMCTLLHWVNSNEIDLFPDDVISVLKAANMFQFESIQEICVAFIIHNCLDHFTCLSFWEISQDLNIVSLHHKAKALSLVMFAQVRKTDYFFNLPIHFLELYLGENGLHITDGEMEIFSAGFEWLQHNPLGRTQYLLRILECIKFSDISETDIRNMIYEVTILGNVISLEVLQHIQAMKRMQNYNGCTITNLAVVKREGLSSESSKTSSSRELKPIDENWDVLKWSDLTCVATNCSSSKDIIPNLGHFSKSQETSGVVQIAKRFLSKPPRTLLQVPCVVAHSEKWSDGIYKYKNKSLQPYKTYLVSFDETQNIPVIVANLNPSDSDSLPSGYRVISRGASIYIIGGEKFLGYGKWQEDIWCYNLVTDTWSIETKLPEVCRHSAVCILGDDLYIIGGFEKYRKTTDRVNKYNFVTRCWTPCRRIPGTPSNVACCVHRGHIYLFMEKVYIYQPNTNMWHFRGDLEFDCTMRVDSAMSSGDFIYLTGYQFRELFKFNPDQTSRYIFCERLGYFKHRAMNTCLANDKIYSFLKHKASINRIQVYNIKHKEFEVVWSGTEFDQSLNLDFDTKYCVGSFPSMKCA